MMRSALLCCIFCLLFPAFPGRAQDSLHIALVKQGADWYAIDREGRRLTPPLTQAFACIPFSTIGSGFVPIKKDRYYGFCHLDGGAEIPARFDSVQGFSNGFAAVQQNGKWGYVNRKGKLCVPAVYDLVAPFDACGRTLVSRYGKTSSIDSNGHVHETSPLPPMETLFPFAGEGRLKPVRTKEGKIGFIDYYGRLRIDTTYEQALFFNYFTNGRAFLLRNDSVFTADTAGNVTFLMPYKGMGTGFEVADTDLLLMSYKVSAAKFSEQTVMEYRFLDLQGRDVFGRPFREASVFENGYASVVTIAGDVTGIDRQGKEIFHNPKSALISPLNTSGSFADNRVLAFQVMNSKTCSCQKLTEYYGYLDSKGDWAIEPAYEKANVFALGLAAVAQDSLFGYIDEKGGWVIPPQYDDAGPFIRVSLK